MAIEIERKFLVDQDKFVPEGKPYRIIQGYLSVEPNHVIRVRTKNEKAYITIKGSTNGISRTEFEYEIPFDDAMQLLEMCKDYHVVKTRWVFEHKGKIWETDVFEAENKGLIIAEIELITEDEAFEKPDWIGQEVSTDVRYFNFNLALNPFSLWQ